MSDQAHKPKNFAFIDGANLHKGVSYLGWKLDYRRFRVWLKDKYSVSRAYIFIGLIPANKELYSYLQECGFHLIFKEVTYNGAGEVKGNCDAELVLRAARDAYENAFERAVLVTSDGDYACLVSFLSQKRKFAVLISPREKCSILLKRLGIPIVYLETQKNNLSLKIKEPSAGTEPSKGLFRGNG